MSLPYQRSESSRASGYYSGASSPERTEKPTWKSTKGRLESKRLWQVVVGIVGLIVLITLLAKVLAPHAHEEDISSEGRIHKNHFVDYEGGLDCRVSSTELYIPPLHDSPAARKTFPFCKNRNDLLKALNGGGRHGFDEPFTPKGCHYKWYTPNEICMILERFDGLVFVGDDLVKQIYAGFNILLRRDLQLGGMKTWEMNDKEREKCRCDHQFVAPECAKFMITSSVETAEKEPEGAYRSPLTCNRIPHFYLPVTSSPAAPDVINKYKELLDSDPHSWKPVPLIHSLGLGTGFDWQHATNSMDEWLTVADNSGRNTPFLWVGPNAAGHLKPPNKIMQEGNNALWHYTIELGKEAARRGVENLALYNSTLQASSWDGSSYGERVNVVQAMMIINWLVRVETT